VRARVELRRRPRTVLAALVLALATALAAAGAELPLTGNGRSPAVAANGDRLVVAWLVPDAFGGGAVWAQRWRDGRALGAPFLVAANGGRVPQRPAVALGARGDFVVVWQQTGPFGAASVVGRVVRANDRPLGGVLRLSADGERAERPRVAIGGDGRFVVAWDSGGDDAPARPRLALFSPRGAPIGRPTTLPAAGEQANEIGGLAVTGTSIFVGWTEYASCGFGTPGGVGAVAAFDGSLHALGAVARVTSVDPCDSGPRVVGLVASDLAVLAVFEGQAETMQRFSPTTGVATGDPVTVADLPDCNDTDCERGRLVTGDRRGRFVLVTELAREVPDGGRFDLFANLFGRDGRPRSPRTPVDSVASTMPQNPAAVLLADGTLATVWEQRSSGAGPVGLVIRLLRLR